VYSIDKSCQLNSYNLHEHLIQLCLCLADMFVFCIWPPLPVSRWGQYMLTFIYNC